MKATSLQAEKARGIIVLPEARSPRGAGLRMLVAVGLVAAMLAAVVVYVWQHGQVTEGEAALSRAALARGNAEFQNQRLEARIGTLTGRVDALDQRIESLRAGLAITSANRSEMRRLLADARQQLRDARQVGGLLGPPLTDGRYIARITAVVAGQAPPRLLIDLGRWFQGSAAVQAARADGVIGPNEGLARRRYYRDRGELWRLVSVAPFTDATLRRYAGVRGPTVVELSRLQQIFASPRPRGERVARDPFWIVVNSGNVISITQQRYP